MNSADLAKILREQTNQRAYIRQLIILEQSASLIKARLYISPDLFVQIYESSEKSNELTRIFINYLW